MWTTSSLSRGQGQRYKTNFCRVFHSTKSDNMDSSSWANLLLCGQTERWAFGSCLYFTGKPFTSWLSPVVPVQLKKFVGIPPEKVCIWLPEKSWHGNTFVFLVFSMQPSFRFAFKPYLYFDEIFIKLCVPDTVVYLFSRSRSNIEGTFQTQFLSNSGFAE